MESGKNFLKLTAKKLVKKSSKKRQKVRTNMGNNPQQAHTCRRFIYGFNSSKSHTHTRKKSLVFTIKLLTISCHV